MLRKSQARAIVGKKYLTDMECSHPFFFNDREFMSYKETQTRGFCIGGWTQWGSEHQKADPEKKIKTEKGNICKQLDRGDKLQPQGMGKQGPEMTPAVPRGLQCNVWAPRDMDLRLSHLESMSIPGFVLSSFYSPDSSQGMIMRSSEDRDNLMCWVIKGSTSLPASQPCCQPPVPPPRCPSVLKRLMKQRQLYKLYRRPVLMSPDGVRG